MSKPEPEAEPRALTETQQKILAAALELFAERGFAATSTAAIAKRAGVAEKTLFANFGTKDRLFEQVLHPSGLQLIIPEAIGGVRETFARSWPSVEALLSAFMHDRLEFVRANPSKLKLIAQAILVDPSRIELFLGAFGQHLAPRVFQTFDSLEAAGQIRKLPRASLARIVMTTTIGYMLARFVLRPQMGWDDEAEIATMIDVLVNGVRPRAAEPSEQP